MNYEWRLIKFVCIVCLAVLQKNMFAEEITAGADLLSVPKQQHLICLDILGIGGLGSINYEYNRFLKHDLTLGISGGFSTIHLRDYRLKFNPDLIFPVAVRLLYGQKHQAEIGVGQTITSFPRTDLSRKNIHTRSVDLNTTFIIGYRCRLENGLIFRISYTPFIKNNNLRNWGALSIGYAFR
jgi:hypothetical protein